MRFSTLALAGFTASATALSDLDGSVWKALEGQSPARREAEAPRNRPVKRADGWNPPSDLAAPLKEVWDHYQKTYDGGLDGNKNWGFHQVMRNNGNLNICVRWDSKSKVTAAEREQIASTYDAHYQKWFKWLYGYNGFPFSKVNVKIVGYAVRDKSLLEGTMDVPVYTDVDADGIPECNIGCSGEAHLDGDYSQCAGGADDHFDHSLWLTDGLEGGFGYSWGQQIGKEFFMQSLGTTNDHILMHEMGHTFGLDDFYDWTPTGITKFIMLAGASMTITDFDGWMYRNWWYYLSEKNGWATGSSSTASVSSAKDTEEKAAAYSPEITPVETAVAETPETTETPSTPETPVADETPAPILPPVEVGDDNGEEVDRWGQCGGSSWTGATTCRGDYKCTKQNDFYSQCL